MMLAVQTIDPASVAVGVTLVCLIPFGLVGLCRWLCRGPVKPEPWGEEIAAKIATDDCAPLCHRCLVPHDFKVDFCPECGAPVGEFTNMLPIHYLYSMGHTFRIGTEGTFRRSPLIITGFILFSLAEYALFAPVYWFFLLRALSQPPSPPPPETEPEMSSEPS